MRLLWVRPDEVVAVVVRLVAIDVDNAFVSSVL